MNSQDLCTLRAICQEVETNPDKTLFLIDNSEPGCPYVEIPLDKDGKLIIFAGGWFIDKS